MTLLCNCSWKECYWWSGIGIGAALKRIIVLIFKLNQSPDFYNWAKNKFKNDIFL